MILKLSKGLHIIYKSAKTTINEVLSYIKADSQIFVQDFQNKLSIYDQDWIQDNVVLFFIDTEKSLTNFYDYYELKELPNSNSSAIDFATNIFTFGNDITNIITTNKFTVGNYLANIITSRKWSRGLVELTKPNGFSIIIGEKIPETSAKLVLDFEFLKEENHGQNIVVNTTVQDFIKNFYKLLQFVETNYVTIMLHKDNVENSPKFSERILLNANFIYHDTI